MGDIPVRIEWSRFDGASRAAWKIGGDSGHGDGLPKAGKTILSNEFSARELADRRLTDNVSNAWRSAQVEFGYR